MKEQFIAKTFAAGTLTLIRDAADILIEYRDKGFIMTLRQVYYQLVARDRIPNTVQSYKRLGSALNDARMAGLLDWTLMEDRARNVAIRARWTDPSEMVAACADQFHIDLWKGQKYRVETWVEKDALVGVCEPACRDLDCPLLACRGYLSASEVYAAVQRFRRYIADGQAPVVLHFGDHDPSGIDMTRDLAERLSLMVGDEVTVRRIALNEDQIRQYEPPPNPAKITDSRYNGYAERFGTRSWELDALSPETIDELIRSHVASYTSKKLMDAIRATIRTKRLELRVIADRFDDAVRWCALRPT